MNQPVDPAEEPAASASGDASASSGSPHEPRSPESQVPAVAEGSEESRGSSAEGAPGDIPTDEPSSSSDPGLPEYEPLTPELVEEEAVRGDVMLRWAAVLIALLLGWTIIDESRVLVQIRSGESLAAHGWLAAQTDALSATASDRTYVNLSWANDLVLAGLYGAGGFGLLTVFGALVAATTFWILGRITLPNVSTWWGSVCAVLAAVACFPYLTPGPDLMTLLGVSLTLAWLHSASITGNRPPLWALAVLFVAWSNLDPRAWLGLALLSAWAVGETFQGFAGNADDSPARPRHTWTSVGVAALAVLVNPFHLHALTSVVIQYTVEYPALQDFGNPRSLQRFTWLSMLDARFWDSLNYFSGSGLLLMLVALVALVLNLRHVRISHLLLFLLGNGLAVANGHELPVASLINCTLAALNAQAWYRRSFRQEYSVEVSELLFSRGGRAITVLAFFALCFAAIGGHLMGADGRRVGMGLSQDLGNQIASLSEVVSESLDDRPFNFVLPQGDLLVWIGQRPFADSRVRLFGMPPSILDELQIARQALRQPREGMPGTGKREDWQQIFNEHDITHVLPRLSAPSPDYLTMRDLLASPDWLLTRLGATAACFYRTDLAGDAQLTEYLAEHGEVDLAAKVFRSPQDETEVARFRSELPHPPSLYDQLVFLPSRTVPNDLQIMRHRADMLESGQLPVNKVFALIYEAIRRSHAGLSESPQEGHAYVTLARLYRMLDELERQILQADGVQFADSLRYFQIISNYHMALQCDPYDAFAHINLHEVFLANGRIDLALKHLLKFQELTRSLTRVSPESPEHGSAQERGYETLTELTDSVDRIREQMNSQLADEAADRFEIVQSLLAVGCPSLALEVIEKDLTVIGGNPALQLLYGQLLLEVGRFQDARQQIQSLEAISGSSGLRDLPTIATMAAVCEGDLPRAESVLNKEHTQMTQAISTLLTTTSPFGPPLPRFQADLTPDWPASIATAVQWQMQGAAVLCEQIDPQLALNEIRAAQVALEMGRNTDATTLLQQLIDRNPQTPFRALARAYLALLTGEDIGPRPAPNAVDERDLFAPADPDEVEQQGTPQPSESQPPADEGNTKDDSVPGDRGTGTEDPGAAPDSLQDPSSASAQESIDN